MLARIQHLDLHEIPHAIALMREDLRPARHLCAPQRHVLVPGLKRRRAPQGEGLARAPS